MKITNEYLTLAESIAAHVRDNGGALQIAPGEVLEILQAFRENQAELAKLKAILLEVAI